MYYVYIQHCRILFPSQGGGGVEEDEAIRCGATEMRNAGRDIMFGQEITRQHLEISRLSFSDDTLDPSLSATNKKIKDQDQNNVTKLIKEHTE